jgi:hypothetical protein
VKPTGPNDDISGVLVDSVAAIDYLSVHARYGLTWNEALEEALREHLSYRHHGDHLDARLGDEIHHGDPDPLRTTLARLLESEPQVGSIDGRCIGDIMIVALESWVGRMADLYNDGHEWAHPAPRRGWPSPRRPNREVG